MNRIMSERTAKLCAESHLQLSAGATPVLFTKST